MSDEPVETQSSAKLLEAKIALACVDLTRRLRYGHDDVLWTQLLSIGPYAMPVVLTMAEELTWRERVEFLKFAIKSFDHSVIKPKHTRAFNKLANQGAKATDFVGQLKVLVNDADAELKRNYPR